MILISFPPVCTQSKLNSAQSHEGPFFRDMNEPKKNKNKNLIPHINIPSQCSAKCQTVPPHRPEMDTEWTYIREPIETNSMVLKGLLPETEYQFVIRAVNVHGASPPSPINSPVRTLSKSDVM